MSKSSAWVFDVAETEFDEKVIKKSHELPVVVDFWAPWCGPCRALAPILERMVGERNGEVLLAKLNTDEAQNLAGRYGISSIPHVMAFRKGQPVLEFVGVLPETQLADFFERLKPTEAEKNAETAAELAQTDPAKAEEMYRLALKDNPHQEDAIVGLARVLVEQRKDKEASEVLGQIGSAGTHGAEADKLRAILWLRENAVKLLREDDLRKKVTAQPKDANVLCDLGCVLAANGHTAEGLETLLKAGQMDRKLASSRVREAMVKIFFVVGVRSELADGYRAKLTALLY